MDAWEILVSLSNAPPDSDAWTHLNSITGGGGLSTTVYIEQLGVELMSNTIEIEVNNASIEVEVPSDSTELEVQTDTIELEVD
jgi:hypothetical protein